MTPILTTKLYLPRLRPNVVRRPRLLERLNEGLHCKLTLISAPAGFGKTTLVSEWLAGGSRPTAWLSLDEGENDPVLFLTYLVAALQTIAANMGEGVLGLLQSSQPPPPESILTALLNDLTTTLLEQFVLVLDDYHVIDTKAVDQALTFLVEHLPPHMHLVITTREDPQFPLARLRARGQLTELRSADLRFTPSEAAEFLNQVMGLTLSAEDIAALERRTEGWIAGLQLAALSMQGHQDVSGFIRAFAGDHRYIVDYLVEEVLERQPEPVRSFLLQTSILDQLSGPLCDAVTGQQEGHARLLALERGNFFVVPLDDKRHWYRYHHLFADVLFAHLRAEQPDQVATLHRRASVWYEQHGSVADAIRHALAAEDFARAADLIELELPAIQRNRQEATLLGWLKALPDKMIPFRPMLCVGYAWVLLSGGELEAADARLQDAERWLDMMADRREKPEAPSAEMVIVDKEGFHRLPVFVGVYRAALALALGDVHNAIQHAQRVLNLVPEEDYLGRGAATGLLGLASWMNGNLELAHRTFAAGMASIWMAGNLSDAINGTIALAEIRMAQGRLHEVMRTYERSLQKALEQNVPGLRGIADLYVGMSEFHREQNDLDTAMQFLLRSKEQGEHTGLPSNRHRWYVAQARINEVQGDLDGALDLLHQAERLYMRDLFPNVRPVAALVTRVWVAQGRLGEALGWVRERGLSAADDLSYLREFEHITLVRVLLARYKSDRTDRSRLEAMGLLERLLKAAEEGGRTGSVIEILMLQALAHQAQGDISAALVPLERALSLAEPEGYVRMFVDEGPPMALLLKEATKHGAPAWGAGNAPNYVRQLLAAFDKGEDRMPVKQNVIEPLSKRELEVLRLLKTGLDGPEIASKLFVSLNTLRTHTKNIYSKLGVNNRLAAILRAEELDLF
ncbi:LuxR C-terminal-related transcriptional regulator [Dictyobacter formicarum]|uniref:LuxR family transcriptional regulator n=1 Tax=Dictyobacter formicarum TaxID=2778368 RepID=A0ABQ3VQ79_9CHLR|nr:LuxR C-terminal-related transcriptional regulator [Dictyobacter formicarum]GHO87536.1 LuxR family transcriptional regulator [Dictyobacter formicarum]